MAWWLGYVAGLVAGKLWVLWPLTLFMLLLGAIWRRLVLIAGAAVGVTLIGALMGHLGLLEGGGFAPVLMSAQLVAALTSGIVGALAASLVRRQRAAR